MNLKLVNVIVNDKKVAVREGTTILNACSLVGVEVSRFCYHEGLSIAGNCRMCLVEVEKAPKPVASCAMPVAEGMVIKTNTDLVKKAREGVMEMLLVNHPLDCPICDQAGECDLQDEAVTFGSDRGRYNEVRRVLEDREETGPLIKTIMTRCIHCTRCIRFAEDIAGVPVYGTTGRGEQTQVGTYIKGILTSELSGNVIDLCPVGALTSKPYQFTARSWELKSTETIDVLDPTCSPVRIDSKGDRILRVLPREIEDKSFFNFITDKTRFAYDGYNTQRLQEPLIKTVVSRSDTNNAQASFERVTWPVALFSIKEKLDSLQGNQLDIVAGSTVDLETLIMLNYLQQGFNLKKLATNIKQPTIHYPGLTYLFNSTQHTTQMVSDVESADVCFIIGSDLRKESPLLSAFVGRSVLKGTLKVATLGVNPLNLTYPALHLDNNLESFVTALKQVIQDQRLEQGNQVKVDSQSYKSNRNTLQAFISLFFQAKKPLLFVADHAFLRPDAQVLCNILALLVSNSNLFSKAWIGYNVIHSQLDTVSSKFVGTTSMLSSQSSVGLSANVNTKTTDITNTRQGSINKVIYLVSADDFDPAYIRDVLLDPNNFIIYQGHHADFGASIADVVLPSAMHTEKHTSYVNYKGIVRQTLPVSQPTVLARKDWEIVAAISQVAQIPFVPTNVETLQSIINQKSEQAKVTTSFDNIEQVLHLAKPYQKFVRGSQASSTEPHLIAKDILIGYLLTYSFVNNTKQQISLEGSFKQSIESTVVGFNNLANLASYQRKVPYKSSVSDYFLTDSITRASSLMAKCSHEYNKASVRVL